MHGRSQPCRGAPNPPVQAPSCFQPESSQSNKRTLASRRPPIESEAGAGLRFDRDRIRRRADHPPLADEPSNPALIDAGPALGQRKQFSLAPTMGQGFLGPSLRDEAVAASAS